MERSELIERLVPLIPPPRAHQLRYHGALAPSASLRDWIVPARAPPLGAAAAEPEDPWLEEDRFFDQSSAFDEP